MQFYNERNKKGLFKIKATEEEHRKFAIIVNKKEGIDYVEKNICEIDGGIKNMINLLAKIFPGLSTIAHTNDSINLKLDKVFAIFSRNGFNITRGDDSSQEEKSPLRDTDVSIPIEINEEKKLEWYFGSSHLYLSKIDESHDIPEINKIDSSMK